MAITLRVVGIFYKNTQIKVPSGSNVEKVLQYAEANPSAGSTNGNATEFHYSDSVGTEFSYRNAVGDQPKASVTSFSATYADGFTSPISGITYPAGSYYLPESLQTTPVYSVWQYYIADSNGVPVNLDPRVTYFDDPLAIVPDNGSVTWRLVNLLAVSTVIPPQVKARY